MLHMVPVGRVFELVLFALVYCVLMRCCVFFFFQAEDGIRDHCVTGVQTCALPICGPVRGLSVGRPCLAVEDVFTELRRWMVRPRTRTVAQGGGLSTAFGFGHGDPPRSEEHTSELQSHSDLVCRLLLEKKKEQQNKL